MQVVHVVRQFYPARGGLENAVYHLAREQLKLGLSVRIVTLNKVFCSDHSLAASDVVDEIEVRRLSFVGSLRYPIAPSVLVHIRDADIVHVHGIDFFFDFLAVTSLFHRRRLIVSTHGGFFHTRSLYRLKQLYFALVTRALVHRYAFVAASSAHDAEHFAKLRVGGLDVLENGVDTAKFSGIVRSDPSKQIIYFGRLAPNKNIFSLLPLLAAMRGLDRGWRLVIAGRPMGITAADVVERADEMGLGEAVRVHELPSDDELRILIEESSVFCSPSSYEGFGIAAIEAISGGLVVALSDIPAHRATIETTGAGLLIDFSDPGKSAALILEAFDHRVAAKNCTLSEQELARTYSWEGVALACQRAYENVLGQDRRLLLKTRVRVLDQADAMQELSAAIGKSTPTRAAFVNAHLAMHAMRSPEVERALAEFLLLNDGVGIDIASTALYGRRFPANLNGTDFTPALLDRLNPGRRLFLLGGTLDVITAAVKYYRTRWPHLDIVGYHHGFFSAEEEARLAETIRASQPDLVLVAMGCPRQELWLARHIPSVCPVGMAVGALFDFQTNQVPRAPAMMRKVRLEWVYRLIQEPRRLSGRYLAGNVAFLWCVARQWLSGVRA